MSDGAPSLPPMLATAWGLRERPNKGPRPALSVERVVAAAIDVARRDGLAAVSMSRVAAELGTVAMALYRYVSAKSELIALMADAAYGPAPELPRPGDTWRTALTAWTHGMLRGARENPWAVEVPITGPPLLPNSVDWFECALRCLAGTPLDGGEKVEVISMVGGLVRTRGQMEHQINAAIAASAPTSVPGGYGRMLSELLPRDRYPEVYGVIEEGVFGDEPGAPGDEDFDFALNVVFEGIEALIRTRA
ncbi:MAG: TetR family transcriptional regulator [Streptosporangiales bacterium]|nr:TetR family transcriptional regulator [Streptosporangiales bacterium]